MLKVSRQPNGRPEIFHSLQGEGANIGTAAVFLRLATCNLACSWCDTKYTWDWHHYTYEREVMEMAVEGAEAEITAFPCSHVVVTGGEPLLQQKPLARLLRSLKDKGVYVEIEPNGTIIPEPALLDVVEQRNVSPKLANSGNPLTRSQLSQALEFFSQLPHAYFKFVMVKEEDLPEVLALVDTYRVPRQRVILMPEGTTPQVVQERSTWLSQVCVQQGFRFSTRLHILLLGDQRGR